MNNQIRKMINIFLHLPLIKQIFIMLHDFILPVTIRVDYIYRYKIALDICDDAWIRQLIRETGKKDINKRIAIKKAMFENEGRMLLKDVEDVVN